MNPPSRSSTLVGITAISRVQVGHGPNGQRVRLDIGRNDSTRGTGACRSSLGISIAMTSHDRQEIVGSPVGNIGRSDLAPQREAPRFARLDIGRMDLKATDVSRRTIPSQPRAPPDDISPSTRKTDDKTPC